MAEFCRSTFQYDYASAYESTVVSLFTWCYNATKSIIPDGTASDNVSITSGNLSQSDDWGCTIGDGNTWRTLSSSEWEYLLSSTGHGDGDKKFKYGVEVAGKTNCLIIAPDGYTGTIATSYDAAAMGTLFVWYVTPNNLLLHQAKSQTSQLPSFLCRRPLSRGRSTQK